MQIIVSIQAVAGLLSCAQAYEARHHQNRADESARERAAILAEQLRTAGQAAVTASGNAKMLPSQLKAAVASCDCQFKAQFTEVNEWLDRGSNSNEQSDARKSLEWLRMAAEAGSPEGQWRLGSAYRYSGAGAEPDRAEAHRWFRRAAAAGHPRAALRLYRDLYSDGVATAASYDAIDLLDKALAANLPDAAFEMSLAIFTGVREGGDPVRAAAWMHLAARWGSELGKDSLPDLLARLDSQQRSEALALSHKLQK